MSQLSRLKVFKPGTKLLSAEVNAEFDNLLKGFNDIDTNIQEILIQKIQSFLQKYDNVPYLVTPTGFKYQICVYDDGSLYTSDYNTNSNSWYNAISPNGTKWTLFVDDQGNLNTAQI